MAGGGTASQLLPRLIAAILRRKAAQNLATFETVYSSHITGRCAAVVAACALSWNSPKLIQIAPLRRNLD